MLKLHPEILSKNGKKEFVVLRPSARRAAA
jgi:hypothetical protein